MLSAERLHCISPDHRNDVPVVDGSLFCFFERPLITSLQGVEELTGVFCAGAAAVWGLKRRPCGNVMARLISKSALTDVSEACYLVWCLSCSRPITTYYAFAVCILRRAACELHVVERIESRVCFSAPAPKPKRTPTAGRYPQGYTALSIIFLLQ